MQPDSLMEAVKWIGISCIALSFVLFIVLMKVLLGKRRDGSRGWQDVLAAIGFCIRYAIAFVAVRLEKEGEFTLSHDGRSVRITPSSVELRTKK